jgi:peptidoglycan/xylan/chitin deacetylase (PgdA/CDA1 family)
MPSQDPAIIFSRGDIYSRQIALTYDCGSESSYAGEILDILNNHGVRATFFVTGEWAENNAEISRRIVSEGHEIGSHSYDHTDLTQLTWENLIKQIINADLSIYRVTGKGSRPLFRLPFGSYSPQVLDTLGIMGYKYCIHWSLETMDYRQKSAALITDRVLSQARNGDIARMHVAGKGTAEATDLVAAELKQQGYELVTVGNMLDAHLRGIQKLYRNVPNRQG